MLKRKYLSLYRYSKNTNSDLDRTERIVADHEPSLAPQDLHAAQVKREQSMQTPYNDASCVRYNTRTVAFTPQWLIHRAECEMGKFSRERHKINPIDATQI